MDGVGYALYDQEAFINDISVAVPLLNRIGDPVGAVNVAVQASRWSTQDVVRKLVPELLQTAHQINKGSNREARLLSIYIKACLVDQRSRTKQRLVEACLAQ
ncbi:IclR family transcriptional regulator C-terminal domain-containing protein [Comamonas sp.]|uniref:IclR family transcriptional regulator domain-containing protein n=1 Tax=Comamonas sp. TaxID=34028 RepID=UPI0039182B1E